MRLGFGSWWSRKEVEFRVFFKLKVVVGIFVGREGVVCEVCRLGDSFVFVLGFIWLVFYY